MILLQHHFAAGSESAGGRGEHGQGLLERTSLYREFVAEREEILRHKWYESEKAGHDIGFDSAYVSWVTRHRALWRRARRGQSAGWHN